MNGQDSVRVEVRADHLNTINVAAQDLAQVAGRLSTERDWNRALVAIEAAKMCMDEIEHAVDPDAYHDDDPEIVA